jgi:hypothetical protein
LIKGKSSTLADQNMCRVLSWHKFVSNSDCFIEDI